MNRTEAEVPKRNQSVGVPAAEYQQVNFVTTPEKKRVWQQAARRMGMSLSAWFVYLADRAVIEQQGE